MSAPGTVHRVIVSFDPTPVGRNALWHAVRRAHERHATLFVVKVEPGPLRLAPWPMLPVPLDRLWSRFRVAVADELVLAVGDVPPELDIRVALVRGRPLDVLPGLADRSDDLLVLPVPDRHGFAARRLARRWRRRTPAAVLAARTPTGDLQPLDTPAADH